MSREVNIETLDDRYVVHSQGTKRVFIDLEMALDWIAHVVACHRVGGSDFNIGDKVKIIKKAIMTTTKLTLEEEFKKHWLSIFEDFPDVGDDPTKVTFTTQDFYKLYKKAYEIAAEGGHHRGWEDKENPHLQQLPNGEWNSPTQTEALESWKTGKE